MKKLKNKIEYIKEKNVIGIILLVIFLSNIFLIAVGSTIIKFLPENRSPSFFDALWSSLRLVVDPGGFLESKLSAIATIVTCLIVMVGTVTFSGGIIGYASNYIMQRIENGKTGTKGGTSESNALRKTNYSDHTLILNWNDKVPLIIGDRMLDISTDIKNDYIFNYVSARCLQPSKQILRKR